MIAPATYVRSIRRSFLRMRLVLILLQRGTVHAGELIDLAGIDAARLRAAMHGAPRTYRRDLALLHVGLVTELRVRGELAYRLTPLGREVGRQVLREKRNRAWW